MSLLFFQILTLILINTLISQNLSNSFPKYLSSNIIEDIRKLLFILPEDKIIPFNNSLINITLYNTSDRSFSYDKMNINFENCLTILQKVYDLDPFFDYSNNDNNEIYKRCFFIIIKIEIDRKKIKDNSSLLINNNNSIINSYKMNVNISNSNITKHPTNHIEYLIFNGKNGNLLNTSYCNDLNVKISHPIIDKNGIDLNISKKLYVLYKIDVYKTNDSFFNDFCMNYTSDKNTDLTLSQRRKIFYQNVSFCDSNCTYIEVNYTGNTAICACEVKDGIMNDKFLRGGNEHKNYKSFTSDEIIYLVNYRLFQCYKQVFDNNRLIRNVGNYTSIIIIFFYSICIIHFCINRKRNAMSYFQKIKLKMEEKKQNEEKNSSLKENQVLNDENNDNEKDNNKINNHENFNEIYNEDHNSKLNNKISNNIDGIIITDISNPPFKKKKTKISKPDNDNNRRKNNEFNLRYNDITKDTNTLVHYYGDIKIDTADELLNKKNENKNLDDIITIKRKIRKKIIKKREFN